MKFGSRSDTSFHSDTRAETFPESPWYASLSSPPANVPLLSGDPGRQFVYTNGSPLTHCQVPTGSPDPATWKAPSSGPFRSVGDPTFQYDGSFTRLNTNV